MVDSVAIKDFDMVILLSSDLFTWTLRHLWGSRQDG